MTTQAESNRALAKSLDLLDIVTEESIDTTDNEVTVTTESPKDCVKEDDFETARKNLRNCIEKGNRALDNLMTLAVEAESLRAYENIPTLISTLVEASNKLVEHHKKIETNSGKPNPPLLGGDSTTNNIVFAGTSKELQKLIQDMKNAPIQQSIES